MSLARHPTAFVIIQGLADRPPSEVHNILDGLTSALIECLSKPPVAANRFFRPPELTDAPLLTIENPIMTRVHEGTLEYPNNQGFAAHPEVIGPPVSFVIDKIPSVVVLGSIPSDETRSYLGANFQLTSGDLNNAFSPQFRLTVPSSFLFHIHWLLQPDQIPIHCTPERYDVGAIQLANVHAIQPDAWCRCMNPDVLGHTHLDCNAFDRYSLAQAIALDGKEHVANESYRGFMNLNCLHELAETLCCFLPRVLMQRVNKSLCAIFGDIPSDEVVSTLLDLALEDIPDGTWATYLEKIDVSLCPHVLRLFGLYPEAHALLPHTTWEPEYPSPYRPYSPIVPLDPLPSVPDLVVFNEEHDDAASCPVQAPPTKTDVQGNTELGKLCYLCSVDTRLTYTQTGDTGECSVLSDHSAAMQQDTPSGAAQIMTTGPHDTREETMSECCPGSCTWPSQQLATRSRYLYLMDLRYGQPILSREQEKYLASLQDLSERMLRYVHFSWPDTLKSLLHLPSPPALSQNPDTFLPPRVSQYHSGENYMLCHVPDNSLLPNPLPDPYLPLRPDGQPHLTMFAAPLEVLKVIQHLSDDSRRYLFW
ncbi:hypothetical protein FISHEDRAFT_68672 [Fistulina hepatica ATCC 64428]|uniref:Uncharacterized protein n=1 Tax=Fistulina hepatica ATCC 64428 TaxID=1128425 RepID=A0A0D7AP86_9AGAR|nr:hypothetical protein FISHEDRAFT_68672 [Fistulina hepatica ATCC 64428]